MQNIQAFGIGRHDAVLNSVVNHLHEMAAAHRSAMQVAILGRAADFFAARRAIDISAPGRQRLEDRIQMFHDVGFAADHQAVPALQAPYAAAGSDIGVVNAFGLQLLGAPNIVDVIGVAAIDDDVALGMREASCSSVWSTTAAGTISQTARGGFSFWRNSSSELEPAAPSLPSSATLPGSLSKTTHSCPAFIRRRTMFAPIRPKPIMPSCIYVQHSKHAAKVAVM